MKNVSFKENMQTKKNILINQELVVFSFFLS